MIENILTLTPKNLTETKSPKHEACGIAQSLYLIYSHGKACLCSMLVCAAGVPRLTCSRSWVSSPGPRAPAARAFFLHPPFLLWDTVFYHLPHHPRESVRVMVRKKNPKISKWTDELFFTPIPTSVDHISKQAFATCSLFCWRASHMSNVYQITYNI